MFLDFNFILRMASFQNRERVYGVLFLVARGTCTYVVFHSTLIRSSKNQMFSSSCSQMSGSHAYVDKVRITRTSKLVPRYWSRKHAVLMSEVESSKTSLASKTSSRTQFEVLGLGLEALGPRKLACPRLEDSTIF